ncbi:MAG: hypothetical protein IPN40_13490 [Uliginosibacterium sp.]|nr:hypothetical protein [Uliginosibacterium sp.]
MALEDHAALHAWQQKARANVVPLDESKLALAPAPLRPLLEEALLGQPPARWSTMDPFLSRAPICAPTPISTFRWTRSNPIEIEALPE